MGTTNSESLWRTTGYAVALVGLTLVIAAAAQNDSPAFARFKSEMMPKVGQKVTVVGTWNDETKQCCWLAFNHWGAYIYAGHAKKSDLFAHLRNGQSVKVTRTLKYFPGPSVTKKNVRAVQIPPEHFFFDAAEVEMSVDPSP